MLCRFLFVLLEHAQYVCLCLYLCVHMYWLCFRILYRWNLCIYGNICLNVNLLYYCLYVFLCSCLCVSIYVQDVLCMCVSVCAYMHACVCACVSMHVCACVCTCLFVCVCVYFPILVLRCGWVFRPPPLAQINVCTPVSRRDNRY